MHTTIIGLDLAKNVFQLHAEDASGEVLWAKRLRREALEPHLRKQPPALIGLEACGSAHHWARVVGPALGHGGASDARQIREGIRQAGQERRARCGGDLRGGAADQHAGLLPIKSVEQQIDRSLEAMPASCW